MKILQINSSLKAEHSYSSKLSNAIIEKLRKKDPTLTVVTRNLTDSPLPHFSENHFKAFSNIPSVLKSWIDFVVRAGKTFRYTPEGANGLIDNKKVYLAIASGGVFSEGPRKMFNFTEPYLKAVLGFIGLTDVEAVRVEGLAIPGIKETALEKAVQNIVIQ